jgi:type IV pilus assembly protein PilN
MMIRINLLPVRQAKKRETGLQLIYLAVVFTLATGVGNYMWVSNRDGELNRRTAMAADTQRRIADLEKTIGEVNNINQRKKQVEDKLAVLEKLRKQRAGPVRLLDALATCTPRKVWIADFIESNGNVKVTGSGESHEDVSEFMRGLQSIVWTPKGIARIVEHKREAPTARVELLTGDGAMEDFPLTEISNFFSNVELRGSELSGRNVKFEINMSANYAI